MRNLTQHIHNIACACVLAFLLFGGGVRCFGWTQQPQVIWYAAPCPQSPEYLEVLVDTRTLPYNSYLTDVNFVVKCRNRSTGSLSTTTVSFTGAGFQDSGQAFVQLDGGHIYRRYIKLPFPQAKFVQATKLQCVADVEGSDLADFSQKYHRSLPLDGQMPSAAQPTTESPARVYQRLQEDARKHLTASLLPPKRVKSKKKLHLVRVITLGQVPPSTSNR